jgi:hypothetical protein
VFRPATAGTPRLTLVAHHLVIDTVSWQIVFDDLAAVYESLAAARPVALPPAEPFSRWARALTHATSPPEPPATVPAELPGGADSLESRRQVALVLDRDLGAELHDTGLRLPDLLLGTFADAIATTMDCAPPVIDVESHGRDVGSGVNGNARTVGWLTAVTPVSFKGTAGTAALIARARSRLQEDRPGGMPQATVLFNFRGAADHVQAPRLGWSMRPAPAEDATGRRGRHPYRLEYQGFVRDGRLHSVICFSTDTYRPQTVERILARMHELLAEPSALVPAPAAAGLSAADLERVLARYRSS